LKDPLMHRLAQLDHQYVWHPFTQMQDWLRTEPIVLVEGTGAVLRDVKGREYLDANASIWTNLQGHQNPRIDAAIRRQLARVAHTSALGLASGPAAELAEQLVRLARGPKGQPRLAKVFYSDDGSTAVEAALKLADLFDSVVGEQWQRRGLRSDGSAFTVATLAQYLMHDPVHHVWDVETMGGEVAAPLPHLRHQRHLRHLPHQPGKALGLGDGPAGVALA
jgi:adenosylmethionine-8-amino-7-oxononanoate aminotransferase